MCAGVAVLASELPEGLAEECRLQRRFHVRGEVREARFLWAHRPTLLPVWHGGRLKVVRWGSRDRRGRLPCTGWTWRTTVEAGGWAPYDAEPVEIPAQYGWENGVWFSVRQGMRGLLVRDDAGEEVVYMVCEPATRYYRVMTRSERMPVLIGEVI